MECSPAGTRTKESQKRNDGASADYIVINVRSRLQRISYISYVAKHMMLSKLRLWNLTNQIRCGRKGPICMHTINLHFPRYQGVVGPVIDSGSGQWGDASYIQVSDCVASQ